MSRRPVRRPRARSRGFTLLEIIVVVGIFAIFAVLAYGGLQSVLRTRTQVEAAQQRLAELQKAYVRLRDDFQQVRNRPVRDNYGDLQPAFKGADNAPVEFTRGGWRNPLFQPRSTLERVAYKLDDGALHRLSWRLLDRAQDTPAVDVVLLGEVTDLRWRFFDAQREWQTLWPTLNTATTGAQAAVAAPPLGVEVRLTTKDLGELRYVFRLGLDPGAPGGGSLAPSPGGLQPDTGSGDGDGGTP